MGKIWIMGDIHGDFKPIRDFSYWNLNRQTEDDVIILLGDVGLNFFFNYRDEKFKEKLGKYHMTYFVIRGNHEERPSVCAERDPANWHKERFFDEMVWVENKYPYIKYAMDYPAFYVINGYKTLIIPGAYSVDKIHRLKNGMSWFEGEQLTENEMFIGKNLVNMYGQFDLILSHTCPIIYQPTDLFIGAVDQSTVDNTMERYLGEIENNLAPYKLWIWGHYHQTRVYPQNYKGNPLMLFNDAIFDLTHFQEDENPYNSLHKLHREVIL